MKKHALPKLALSMAMLCLPLSALATDVRGNFAVKSMGTANCQSLLDARAKGDREYVLFAGYLGGYMTAYNQYTPGTFDILPWQSVDTLLSMMASYCLKNPQTVLAVAVTKLVKLLENDRLATPSNMVEARVGDRRAQIYTEALARAQKKLVELRFYRGATTGEFDTATQRALEKFQVSRKIPRTGLPDQATMVQLLMVDTK